ncbi:MAG: DNA repair ATPase, partial [Myxococcota bacterium]
MADEPNPSSPAQEPQIDQGAYRVIRQRLERHAVELRERLDRLNADRREVFGGTELKLIGSDRVTTPHNCVPRDMLAIGERLLFGFNVRFGLKKQITPADVLAVYRFADGRFHEEPLDTIADPSFEKDFADLYRYYKDTRFARFFSRPPHVHMKFHVGQDVDDFKTFKWAVEPGDDPNHPVLHYLDPRSDHEVRYPRQSPFEWQRATREMQRPGLHPHVSIEDVVFVECISGDLTIKVEDNTQTGKGIYHEPVDNPDQTLDDAEVHYVVQGSIVLLRIKPFQEERARHFIFNTKTQEVIRQDAIASACQLLPEDHGIVFPTGYYLASGVTQTFPNALPNSYYERTIVSPNGEDYLIVFYQRKTGQYTLMPYNLIGRRVDTPIVCHGYTLFADGSLVLFQTHEDAQKHHAVQVWQSPFHGPDYTPQTPHTDSQLYKIGNRDIVRAMAECAALLQLIGREELYQELYVDIVAAASGLLDSYHWLGDEASQHLAEPVEEIRQAGQAAIGEYEKLLRDQRATALALDAAEQSVDTIVTENGARIYDGIEAFVEALTGLRRVRGEVISLRELKHVDTERVDALETQLVEQTNLTSERTVAFLMEDRALEPYR